METLSLSRIGIFDSRYHVPVVGGREHGEHGVTTPMELFGKEDVDFVVIQQRSPVLKVGTFDFFKILVGLTIFQGPKGSLCVRPFKIH